MTSKQVRPEYIAAESLDEFFEMISIGVPSISISLGFLSVHNINELGDRINRWDYYFKATRNSSGMWDVRALNNLWCQN